MKPFSPRIPKGIGPNREGLLREAQDGWCAVKPLYESKVQPEPNTGCWLWAGGCSSTGYGSIRIEGRTLNAHRYFYEQLVSPVPRGLVLDHKCQVRSCVNPAHLEAVTQIENVRRGDAQRYPREQIEEAKRLLTSGMSIRQIAILLRRDRSSLWRLLFRDVPELIKPRQKLSTAQVEAARRVRDAGGNVAEIARSLGVATSSLHERLRATPRPVIHGPHRLAAMAEGKDGHCKICDGKIPPPGYRARTGKYTCGTPECQRAWQNLCTLDWQWRKRQMSRVSP